MYRPSCPSPSSNARNCIVCIRPIIATIEEPSGAWKVYHQPLSQDERSHNVSAALLYRPPCKPIMHSCCWVVTRRVLQLHDLDVPSQVKRLLDHLSVLYDFARKTPFDCQTDDIDHELHADTQSGNKRKFKDDQEYEVMLPTISVLKNLEDLRQRPSPMRLEDAFKFNGFLGYCLEKGMPYALAFNKDMDVKPHLQRVLKTFSSSDASRFPKTCNLLAAWSNVEAAVKAMQTASQPRFLETNPEIFSFNSVLKLGIPTEHCQKLIFTFTSGALSGFAYNGKFFGRIDPSESHHIQIGAFRGIQIARDAFGGLTAIKVKDGQSWSGWIGKPQLALFDIVLEWNGPKQGLIFQFHKTLHRILEITMARESDWLS